MSMQDKYNSIILEKTEDTEKYDKEEVKQYILELCNEDSWLDKRVNFAFSTKHWMYDYTTKEDVKQEFYTKVFGDGAIKGILLRPGKTIRMKYINRVFTNALTNQLKKMSPSRLLLPLNESYVADTELLERDLDKKYNELKEDESIENEVIEMIVAGYSDKEIKELTELTRRNFDKIKDTLRKKMEELINGNDKKAI